MKIAISGASGFVGGHLARVFADCGYIVVPLGREFFADGAESLLAKALSGCDVVINLAGAPINHRWTKKYRQELYESRVGTTRRIVQAINSLDKKPELLISASAVGYYPDEGCHDEYTPERGSSFLSDLCVAWESESQKVDSGVRLVNTRFGVVLGTDGGAFPRMATSASLGVGTVLGSGSQPFSWVDIDDLGRAMEFIIGDNKLHGAVNIVAPGQVDNRAAARAIAKRFKCLFTMRIPKLFFRIAMGEASIFVTHGQCVRPTKLLDAGFRFVHPKIEDFLRKVR